MIHSYQEEEEAFFRNLNGWFSGIIFDCQRGETALFNDRYGLKKIYYQEKEDSFFFSSEAKSLLKIFPSFRTVGRKFRDLFILCQKVLDRGLSNGIMFAY